MNRESKSKRGRRTLPRIVRFVIESAVQIACITFILFLLKVPPGISAWRIVGCGILFGVIVTVERIQWHRESNATGVGRAAPARTTPPDCSHGDHK
jgi:hypothetical protein